MMRKTINMVKREQNIYTYNIVAGIGLGVATNEEYG